MSGLNYKKLGSTLSNICNTTQLDNATICHYAFKNFWGEPCSRNISMKLFQNLTSSFREDGFLRICLCSCRKSSPHSPEPCSMIDQNLANDF